MELEKKHRFVNALYVLLSLRVKLLLLSHLCYKGNTCTLSCIVKRYCHLSFVLKNGSTPLSHITIVFSPSVDNSIVYISLL